MISLIIKLFIISMVLLFLAFIAYITIGLAWIVFKLLCVFIIVFLVSKKKGNIL